MLDEVWALDRRPRRARSTRPSGSSRPSARGGRCRTTSCTSPRSSDSSSATRSRAEDVPDDLPHVKNDIGKANERWIESRRGVDRRRRARPSSAPRPRARIEQLRGLDDDGFAADSWTPMGPGTVARPAAASASSTRGSTSRTCGAAVDRPGDLDSPAAAQARSSMMVGVLPVRRREEGGGSRRFHRRARAHRTARRAPPRVEVVERPGPPARHRRPTIPTVTPHARRRTRSPASPAGGPIPARRWSRARSRSTATSSSAARSCASSTTCSDADPNRGVPMELVHQRRARERVRAPPAAPARLRRRRARPRRAARLPRPRGPVRHRAARGARSRRRPASPGTTWRPRDPEAMADGFAEALAAVDDLLDAACAEHGMQRGGGGRRRLLAGRRPRARARRSGRPTGPARPACWR